jgi:phosphate transport system protein
MRPQFKKALIEIKKETKDLFGLVASQVSKALEAIEKRDLALCEEVRAGDDEIDRRVNQLEERAIEVVATQFPVAKDLRLLYSVMLIGVHLERIGDLAFNTATAARTLINLGEVDPGVIEKLLEMGRHSLAIIEGAAEGFERQNPEAAAALAEKDELVDRYFKEFIKMLGKFAQSEHSLEWYSTVILIARYLERMADQAVDISERVQYWVTGEFYGTD